MVSTGVRIAAHVLLFLLAVVVFFFGLGVGLQFNPTLGTLLWVASRHLSGLHKPASRPLKCLALNLFWILRSRR